MEQSSITATLPDNDNDSAICSLPDINNPLTNPSSSSSLSSSQENSTPVIISDDEGLDNDNDSAIYSLSDINNPLTNPSSSSSSQENSTPVIITDDEVEIIAIVKKEGNPGPSIKVESGDENEDCEFTDEKKSIDLKMVCDQESAAGKGNASPKDQTCSICLSEYDNKAFLDQCFRILLRSRKITLVIIEGQGFQL